MLNLIQAETLLVLIALLSLGVGSFLNVVIYRLPIMLEHSETCREQQSFNLLWPASHCPNCNHPLKWRHNLPIISYLVLRGQCAFCHQKISLRYFIVESVTLLLALILMLRFGLTWQLLPLLLLTWLMVAITFIDAAHLLIPDQLNYGLLWLGLLFSTTSLWPYTTPTDAIIGAAVAYLFLATIAWSFKWLMKKEGMGQGDFKLIAALAAWSGWQLLLPIILISGMMALLYAITVIIIRKKNQPIPFAPFLCSATFIALLYQQPLLQFYFHSAHP